MSILVLNAGSSTLKFSLFDASAETVSCSGFIERGDALPKLRMETGTAPSQPLTATGLPAQLAFLHTSFQTLTGYDEIAAVGHRVVHGGEEFTGSILLHADHLQTLESLSQLAPLHNPPALEAIHTARLTWPDVPQIACFDTAFFSGLKPERYRLPVPLAWYGDWGIRRYGFHGLSHDYCSRRAAELIPAMRGDLRIVICHLGSGCSATAVLGGTPVATTMGLTPLDGLMMGTRPGSIDPGVVLEAQRRGGLTIDEVDAALNRKSGLLAISEESADYRIVEQLASQGDERAVLALTMFENRIAETVASLCVALGGLDVLVFTAGIGENAAQLRSRVCSQLSFLGIRISADLNAANAADQDIAAADSSARVLVIKTREDAIIAREACRLVHTLA